MSRLRSPAPKKILFFSVTLVFLVAAIWQLVISPASGDRLANRTLQVASNQIHATTDYNLAFDLVTSGTLGSVVAEFCSNDPLVASPCTVPAGMDISQANLVSQTGPGGFSISNASTVNRLILTRAPTAASPMTISFQMDNVVNPSATGTYYVRLFTYPTADGSGSYSDYGGIAFSITDMVAVTAIVPPFLTFCTGITIAGQDCANATGDYINFGELSSKKASSGSSQMLVATNAELGFAVTAGGTTLTSGNNVISPLSTGDISRPGVAQFGYNLRANSSPSGGSNPTGPGVSTPQSSYNIPNVYRFVNNETIVSHTGPEDVRTFTASYIVNVPSSQPSGIYVSTITYVCLANF